MLTLVVMIIVIVGIVSYVYPPNNWDSMTYHMSRVMHWIKNQSVNFYPTSNQRQLFLNPWAEFAILHLQLLNHGDLLANSVQFICMIGSILGVSLIAKELKSSIRGQIMSAVICATIPMAILQGSSTQNDGVVAFWLVCLVYFGFLLKKNPRFIYAFGVGISLGLSVLTKATAYIFAFPFLICIVIPWIKKVNPKKWKMLFLIAAITLLLNSGHYLRNYNFYRHPLGISEEDGGNYLSNELYSPSSVLSNIIRNASLHLGTSSKHLNRYLEQIVELKHDLIGLSTNDQRTTYRGTSYFIPGFNTHEDHAGNLLHVLLLFSIIVLYSFKQPKDRLTGIYIALVITGFVLFSGYLKWQPWHSRLHLPLFVLASPYMGTQLSKFSPQKVQFIVISLLFINAVPYLFLNQTRPLLNVSLYDLNRNRDQLYYNNRPTIRDGYLDAVDVLREIKCSHIGLIISGDSYEYPLWVTLEKSTEYEIIMRHVNVDNLSRNLHEPYYSEIPCAIFTLNDKAPDEIIVEEKLFPLYWTNGSENIYSDYNLE